MTSNNYKFLYFRAVRKLKNETILSLKMLNAFFEDTLYTKEDIWVKEWIQRHLNGFGSWSVSVRSIRLKQWTSRALVDLKLVLVIDLLMTSKRRSMPFSWSWGIHKLITKIKSLLETQCLVFMRNEQFSHWSWLYHVRK